MGLLECNLFVFEGFEDFEDFWKFGFVFLKKLFYFKSYFLVSTDKYR